MKIRNILYAAAAITFAACSSNENDGLGEPRIPLTIEASVAEANTRAAVSGFTSSSTIGVSLGDVSNVKFVPSEGSTTTFVPAADAATIYLEQTKATVTAYAPYSADDEISLDASDQDALTDVLYADGTANIVTGRANLIFQHRLSKITFVVSLGDGYADTDELVKDNLTELAFSGLDTKGTYNAVDNTVDVTTTTEQADITPVIAESLNVDGSLSASAIVLPQSTTAIQLSMTYDGCEYAGTLDFSEKSFELERGNNYVFHLKINKVKLTVNLSDSDDGNDIGPWDVVTGTGGSMSLTNS